MGVGGRSLGDSYRGPGEVLEGSRNPFLHHSNRIWSRGWGCRLFRLGSQVQRLPAASRVLPSRVQAGRLVEESGHAVGLVSRQAPSPQSCLPQTWTKLSCKPWAPVCPFSRRLRTRSRSLAAARIFSSTLFYLCPPKESQEAGDEGQGGGHGVPSIDPWLHETCSCSSVLKRVILGTDPVSPPNGL